MGIFSLTDDSSSPDSAHQAAAFRVLDAAANRASEGLRVIEDFDRFILDDSWLTGQIKQLRHDLASVLARIPTNRRSTSRETIGDVGTRIGTLAEGSRADLAAVCEANFHRICEALRSLEEYGKLLDGELAGAIEQLRYRVYTLQKCTRIHQISRQCLEHHRLYVLVDGQSSGDDFSRLAEALVEAGVSMIQLRDKRLTDRHLADRARRLVAITRGTDTVAIVNDRPDIAAVTHADGVHVGQDELTVQDARSVVGPDALIGVSIHSVPQAETAVLDGASYLGVGPVFASRTKEFDAFPGLALVRDIAALTRLPWFAIGGITLDNLGDVLAAGATRCAIGAAVVQKDPIESATAARAFLRRFASELE
ncbi:MAG: thiamine phosphate synthase [Pirellulales bacterium]|nr:thiamine phosphate synthase [Pirellulales bacterium]